VLNLPQTLNKFKIKLIKQQKEIEKNLKNMKDSDAVKEDSLAESSEPGTDSWLADAHGRTEALRQNLMTMLQSTKVALVNLKKGSYGKCKKCGKDIELARLEAMPTATLCLSCSRKK
jgi:DnaK suppressor protein